MYVICNFFLSYSTVYKILIQQQSTLQSAAVLLQILIPSKMHVSIAAFLCFLTVCVSLFPGFLILGYYQSAILDATPKNWLNIMEVTNAAFQFLSTTFLCLLSIMLYSDLALPSVMCCFGWIFSRISLPNVPVSETQNPQLRRRRSSFSSPSQFKNKFMDKIDNLQPTILASNGRQRFGSSIH